MPGLPYIFALARSTDWVQRSHIMHTPLFDNEAHPIIMYHK